ncbi:uncharacterized protein LOC113237323 isoform X2 [Hyposmocoma kahamanoa]|uniref:uncharacterized protein LOC113237323 isoform X2 n=1 Tax=Hyposmocoma kahamanoa TaxID=1477025 RepID=UPI000E6D9746|nr:uncharacterized protein LOC113237323 isoform X2 [Hyposmocoma kahamanoa]
MLSKFALVNARGSCLTGTLQRLRGGAARPQPDPLKVQVRRSTGHILPPSQYDARIPDKMKFGTLIINNYEIIPVFVVTAFSLTILFFHIIWASKNKVDVVWQANSRDNISRTMDLDYPTVHKMFIINQIYEPWPEMKIVLKKMHDAAHRQLSRQELCNYK